MKVMLSIKPEYVERILSGEKRYEFRRRVFKRPDVDTIVIYETAPVSKVVAEAHVDEIIAGTAWDVWDRTGQQGGISRERFMDYFRGASAAHAIALSCVRPLARPQALGDYAPEIKAAPQSFVYVN
ncbi:ASCH domain-containing protein [Bifidobacterium pseudocatenulatum]|uniref:ASCH domain-containing protein n=1 Tax=Bifidobacterium pseudocatenulatum TaxID=28026 RepID=UPI0015F9007E|nr:ASCH domain-containing protein [Bifidobacterium pseudocatenulatum]